MIMGDQLRDLRLKAEWEAWPYVRPVGYGVYRDALNSDASSIVKIKRYI